VDHKAPEKVWHASKFAICFSQDISARLLNRIFARFLARYFDRRFGQFVRVVRLYMSTVQVWSRGEYVHFQLQTQFPVFALFSWIVAPKALKIWGPLFGPHASQVRRGFMTVVCAVVFVHTFKHAFV
jgi:hypothetical protein